MPRISVLAPFLAATLAFLASCASPEPPRTAQVRQSADPCRIYDSPTKMERCHLFTSADGWRFIPEIGRTADLDTQIRCAPVAPDLDVYAHCIGRGTGAAAVATPVPATPAAAPATRASIKAQAIARDVAADDFEQILRKLEELDAALSIPPRVEPAAPTEPASARTVPKAPMVAEPEQSTRGWPLCSENGSC
jgi:hypothetical protein